MIRSIKQASLSLSPTPLEICSSRKSVIPLFFSDTDSYTNSELFWKNMSLGLWGVRDTDPKTVQDREEEIINRNIQFNLFTESSVPLNEKLVQKFKHLVTEQPLNEESSVIFERESVVSKHGSDYYSGQNSNSHEKDDSESTFIKPSTNNLQDVLKPISYRVTGKGEKPNNAIGVEFKEDQDNQAIHEGNAGSNQYVYTETATYIEPSSFKSLNDESHTTTDGYDNVYDDQVSNIVKDVQDITEDNSKSKFPQKMENEATATEGTGRKSANLDNLPRSKKAQNSINHNKNKLDDFMGPYTEENIQRNINNQDIWKKWLNAFLPKEEAIGYKYQQELLGKMFPKRKSIDIKYEPNAYKTEHTSEPGLYSRDRPHHQTPESHDHGDDYAPVNLNVHYWQSIAPMYQSKHHSRFHSGQYSEKSPSHYRGDKCAPSGYGGDILQHKQEEHQQNRRKERYTIKVYYL